jgi:hypothetical protein
MPRRTSLGCFVLWLSCGLPTVASAEPPDAETTVASKPGKDGEDEPPVADKRISAAL